jgi:hypothetical protein
VKTLSDKLGIKEKMRTIFINADPEVLEDLELPPITLVRRLTGAFDYIHMFSTTQEELNEQFFKVKSYLKKSGMLWVSWPKAGQLDTDLNIKSVIRIGYNHNLVESKAISLGAVWSALKFTYPKEGKEYNNSYGTLPR